MSVHPFPLPVFGWLVIIAIAFAAVAWIVESMHAGREQREHEYESAVRNIHYCEARKGGGRCAKPAGSTPIHTRTGDYYLCTRCATEVQALQGWAS